MTPLPAKPIIRPLDRSLIADLGRLFESSRATHGCWCMWFIIPVRDYHAGRGDRNGQAFAGLVESEAAPMGLLAYMDGRPVGWVAVGPRSRYARAVKTPTLRDTRRDEDDAVWLVSCFYVLGEFRRRGIAAGLLDAAVALASRSGAPAIEGFPTQGSRVASNDAQVGTEAIFAARGFRVAHRPSTNRVLMRLDLG